MSDETQHGQTTGRSTESPAEPTPGAPAEPTARTGRRTQPEADGASARRGRRAWWIAAGLVVLLVVVGGVVWAVAGGDEEPVAEPTTPPAVTITNPLPTPEVSPVAKEPGTPLYDLMPTTVLQFALSATTTEEPGLAPWTDGALEVHRLAYVDADGTELIVVATQWETAQEAETARAAADAAVAAELPDAVATTDPVLVGEAQTGTATTRAGDPTGVVTWSNGTAVLRAEGPADVVRDVFLAFPI